MAKEYPKDAHLIELLALPRPEHWIPYSEQLKDPRWLWIRLAVIQRDRGCCRICGRTINLQVHHLQYESGLMAWEYPFEYLVTLCSRCHATEHGILSEIDFVRRPYDVSRPVLSIREVMIKVVESVSKTVRRQDG